MNEIGTKKVPGILKLVPRVLKEMAHFWNQVMTFPKPIDFSEKLGLFIGVKGINLLGFGVFEAHLCLKHSEFSFSPPKIDAVGELLKRLEKELATDYLERIERIAEQNPLNPLPKSVAS